MTQEMSCLKAKNETFEKKLLCEDEERRKRVEELYHSVFAQRSIYWPAET